MGSGCCILKLENENAELIAAALRTHIQSKPNKVADMIVQTSLESLSWHSAQDHSASPSCNILLLLTVDVLHPVQRYVVLTTVHQFRRKQTIVKMWDRIILYSCVEHKSPGCWFILRWQYSNENLTCWQCTRKKFHAAKVCTSQVYIH